MTLGEETPLAAAFAEARLRVFGGGFDTSFRAVLGLAYVAGAIFLGTRGGVGPASIAAGFVSMALFLAMPLVTIFTYLFGLSFLAHLGEVSPEADPPMRAVFAAFAVALLVAASFVSGAFALPVIGAQLRVIFG
jgi:predicted membrane metal-binding protein